VENSFIMFARRSAARISEGSRLYVIGDVHGCSLVLQRLVTLIDAHLTSYPTQRPILVFLGDYVDRGPGARDAIDQLIALRESRETVFLKGNHESCLLEFLNQPATLAKWIQYGGLDTLKSYGLNPTNYFETSEQERLAVELCAVLDEIGHLEFLRRLRNSFVCGDFFFVHAGVRPGVPLDRQSEEDLLWIRDEFLQYPGNFGKIVVHGHTPVSRPEVCSNRINVDTGAYATGRLTCLMLEQDKMKFISAS